MTRSRLEVALQELISATNTIGSTKENVESVQTTFGREHRTLQQMTMTVVILPILEQLAKDYRAGWTDARNERAGALAVKMLEALEDEDKCLPLI